MIQETQPPAKPKFKGRKLWSPARTLRGRMMAVITIVLVVTMVAILATSLFYIAQEEYESWRNRQTDIARSADATIEGFLSNIQDTLIWSGLFAEDELRSSSAVLQLILDQSPAFLELVYIQPDGQIAANIARDRDLLSNPVTLTQTEWFNRAISGSTYYSPAQISADAEPYIIMSTPTMSGYVFAARISLTLLWDLVDSLHFGQFGQSYIVNLDGILLAHSDRALVMESKKVLDNQAFQRIKDQPGYKWHGVMRNFFGHYVVSSTASVGNTGWIIITEIPLQEAFSSTITVAWLLPIFLFIFTLIAIRVIGRMIDQLFLEPVSRLHAGAEHIGGGDFDYRIDITQQDELGQVMSSFNQMADRLNSQHIELEAELVERKRAQEALRILNEELESRVVQRTAQLSASLAEKEVLIKEVHHRVKNNLQIISSLLTLQSRNISDPRSLSAFTDSQNRVRSMALIHEKLYLSESLEKVDFSSYIRLLTASLFDSYRGAMSNIQLSLETDPVALNLTQSVLCGLIINEIVSNALKYAFIDQQTGVITIVLRQQPDDQVSLRVADNGVGLPSDLDIQELTTLGLKLITSLTDQLNGELNIVRNNGTEFLITFYNQLGK
jgi:two-component sensor histidine kinase